MPQRGVWIKYVRVHVTRTTQQKSGHSRLNIQKTLMEFTMYITHETSPAHTMNCICWVTERIYWNSRISNKQPSVYIPYVGLKRFFNFHNKARALLEKLEVPQPVNICQALYGKRRFSIVRTRAHHLPYPKLHQ